MKKHIKDKQTVKCGPEIFNGVDSHKWENKMEIQHLTSSKADVKVIATLRKNRTRII
jgi:hypothetical protein